MLESHKINPVLYVDFEHLSGADKTHKESVGFDGKEDLRVPKSEAHQEHQRTRDENSSSLSVGVVGWHDHSRADGWGLTDDSAQALFRIGISQEVEHFSKLFRGTDTPQTS